MKKKSLLNLTKLACVALACVLVFNAITVNWVNGALKAEAADTLQSIENMRNAYMVSSDTFTILEVVPDEKLAELGYYVSGQEPLPELLSENGYESFTEKLASIATASEREQYANSVLGVPLQAIQQAMGSDAPFTFSDYREEGITEEIEGARSYVRNGVSYRGYFRRAEEAGNWNVVFTRMRAYDVTLDDINNSKTTPYYLAKDATESYTYEGLMQLASENPTARVYVKRNGEVLEYAGTAEEIWSKFSDPESPDRIFTISGNDAEGTSTFNEGSLVSEGNVSYPAFNEWVSVSEGDANYPAFDSHSGYYYPAFVLATLENPAVEGDEIYVVDSYSYVNGTGEYNIVPTEPGVAPGENYYESGEVIYYTGGIFNKEILKEKVWGIESEDLDKFHIQVQVATPATLNETLTAQSINDIDMIYINSGNYMRKIYQSALGDDFLEGMTKYSATNDFTENMVKDLALWIKTSKIPCVFDLSGLLEIGDQDYKTTDITGTNLGKLASALISGYDGTDDSIVPLNENLSTVKAKDMGVNWADYDLSFVQNSVWFCNKAEQPILKEDKYTDEKVGWGFAPVKMEIETENLYRQREDKVALSTDIYDTIVMRYTIGFKNQREEQKQKQTLRILDIEPASNFDGKQISELKLEKVRIFGGILESLFGTLDDWIRSEMFGTLFSEVVKMIEENGGTVTYRKNYEYYQLLQFLDVVSNSTGVAKENITIVTMPINEFIGKTIDLNDEYDIVYIGASTLSLNAELIGRYYDLEGGNYLGFKSSTIYNDPAMRGLVYSHVGDTTKANVTMSGLLDTDKSGNGYAVETTHRYTGNDLTLETYNALIDYMKTYYPIVINDDLLLRETGYHVVDNASKLDYTIEGKIIGVNEYGPNKSIPTEPGSRASNEQWLKYYDALAKVDNSSYISEFINEALFTNDRNGNNTTERTPNVFALSELIGMQVPEFNEAQKRYMEGTQYNGDQSIMDYINERKESSAAAVNRFQFYVNRERLALETWDPATDNSIISTTSMYNERVSQILPDANGTYSLSFDFVIRNEGAVSDLEGYTCKLYLDGNADGKFSEEYEELGNVDIIEITDYSSRRLNPGEDLKAGVKYRVSREVPDSYIGCITWKLEVRQAQNPKIRTAEIGYTKLLSSTDSDKREKLKDINILQIYPGDDTATVINLKDIIGSWDENDRGYKNANTNADLYKKANTIKDDYHFIIDTISSKAFDQVDFNDSISVSAAGIKSMDKYDILIIGMSDAVDQFDLTENMDQIISFIASGRSVLFTHDMTSSWNLTKAEMDTQTGSFLDDLRNWFNKNKKVYWGYNINRTLRDLVGMDMYGITAAVNNYSVLKAGQYFSRNSAGLLVNGEGTVLPEPSKSGEKYNYTYGDNSFICKNVAYAPNLNREKTVPETQGYSAYELNRAVTIGGAFQYNYRDGLNLRNASLTSDVISTNTISKVNDGQITNYPFVVGNVSADNKQSAITVAQTHCQYYALDMNGDSDNDGQTDIVVWYTLSGGRTGILSKGVFDLAYGDVLNNYYMYSKGNIIYSGVGHVPSGSSDTSNIIKGDEASLFINTLVAASAATTKIPNVVSMDNMYLPTDTLYNYYDSMQNDTKTGDEVVSVYFSIEDLNMGKMGKKTAEVKFYTEDEKNGANSENPDGSFIDPSRLTRDITTELKLYQVKNPYSKNPTKVQIAQKNERYTDLPVDETVYCVDVPAKYFNTEVNGYSSLFYISAQTTIVKESITGDENETKTGWNTGNVRYVNVELFDLD